MSGVAPHLSPIIGSGWDFSSGCEKSKLSKRGAHVPTAHSCAWDCSRSNERGYSTGLGVPRAELFCWVCVTHLCDLDLSLQPLSSFCGCQNAQNSLRIIES